MPTSLTAAEIAEQYREEIAAGMGRTALMRESGCTSHKAQRAIEIVRETQATVRSPQDPHVYQIPPSPVEYKNKWLELSGDFALISDLHVPYYDAELIQRWIQEAERRGVKQAVLIGDTMDGNQFHPKRGGLQHERRYQDDVEAARGIFREMLKWFEKVVVLNGNHDAWFQAHMRGQVDPEWMLGVLFHEFEGRVVWSQFEQASCTSGGKEFRLLHGANYSGPNPLGVGQRYAAKFGCGIVMGHQHHHAAGFDLSGQHQVVCMGGAHDPRRLDYIHRSPRTNPAQTQGFAMLQDGWVRDFPGGRI